MKFPKSIVPVVAALLLVTSACTTSRPLPPGQAKKASGSKSAKPFAPGQQKKH